MRILVFCRLYSGIRPSLAQGHWQPAGVPTFYKLVEHLSDQGDEVELLLLDRGGDAETEAGRGIGKLTIHSFRKLAFPVQVFRGWSGLSWLPRRLRDGLCFLREQLWLLTAMRRHRPDLIYIDRANVLTGALLSRFLRRRVVLRLMGVTPEMWSILDGSAPSLRLKRWAFQSPFRAVICSHDGSGGSRWMDQALAEAVPRLTLFNGVDRPPAGGAGGASLLPATAGGRMVLLWVGRLERIKGCESFLDAILALSPTHREYIHVVIIGGGSLETEMRQRIAAAGAEDWISMTGGLPHEDVMVLYGQADAYVTLNRMGSYSNTSLEAMAAGLCFIHAAEPEQGEPPPPQAATLLTPATCYALPAEGESDALRHVLEHIIDHPQERRAKATALHQEAERLLWRWSERMAFEHRLLGLVAADTALRRDAAEGL